MKIWSVFLTVLGLTSLAAANIQLTTSITPTGIGNFMYVDLFLTGDEPAYAVNVTFTGNFAQQWIYDDNAKIWMTSEKGTISSSPNDSHFLDAGKDMLVINLTEDNNLSGSVFGPASSGYGMGTTLSGFYGIVGNTSTNYMFARIVTDRGFHVAGQAANGNDQEFNLSPFILDPVWVGAGGPYVIDIGQSITLQGSNYCSGDIFSWDLDNDGQYDDAEGETPTISYDYLVNTLGLSWGTHEIKFMGTSTNVLNGCDIDSTMLTIVPEPASLVLLALGDLGLLRCRKA